MHCFREERLNYAVTGQLGRITDISSFPSVHHAKAMLPLSDPAPREYNREHISAPSVTITLSLFVPMSARLLEDGKWIAVGCCHGKGQMHGLPSAIWFCILT